MSWFKQAGLWLGNGQAEEKVSVETTTRHLLASLLAMAWFVEARDPYTGGHLWRVSRYARLLAEQAKFSDAEAARVGLGGFLHDLGKIGIPDAMTSHRPYRQGMPRDKALAILNSEKGTQFDADFADIFVTMGNTGQLDHVLGHSDDGIPLQNCPMCGPTLVLRKGSNAGNKIYCRNCTGEFEIKEGDHCLVATPTGHQGRPADLVPDLDTELIQRTVIASVDAMPAMALLGTSTAHQASH